MGLRVWSVSPFLFKFNSKLAISVSQLEAVLERMTYRHRSSCLGQRKMQGNKGEKRHGVPYYTACQDVAQPPIHGNLMVDREIFNLCFGEVLGQTVFRPGKNPAPVSSPPSSLILSCLPLPTALDTLSFQKVTDQKIVEGKSPARRLIPAVAGPLLEASCPVLTSG